MKTKYGFTQMNFQEFESWIDNLKVARTILIIQQHHTFSPNYSHFNGNNHFELQRGMKNHHINTNGWMDIGQHFTIFPDGMILTGRSIEASPACIYGRNASCICIENLGNFDINGDSMNQTQKDSIVEVTAKLCMKFNIQPNENTVVYHHWFDLNSGIRNNGFPMAGQSNKTCPGTNFFGGNKLPEFNANFLPLLKNKIANFQFKTTDTDIKKYVCVNVAKLNIRTKADAGSPIAKDRNATFLGAVLRVYKIENGWYKISQTKEHWVKGSFTVYVQRAKVNADTLNVRSGPNVSFTKIGSFNKGDEVFIVEEENGWCRISMDEKWVSKDFLDF